MARVLCLVLVGFLAFSPSASASPGQSAEPRSYGYFDFATCVRYALVHSQAFLYNRLNIQIKSADLKDAHSQLLPTVQVLTRYYLARAGGEGRNPFSVQLLMKDWDPYGALLQIKSRKIIVDIATTQHQDKISENISNMAKLFYRIDVLDRMMRARRQLTDLLHQKVSYGQSRIERDSYDRATEGPGRIPIQIEVREWDTALKEQEVEIKELQKEKDQKIAQLKILMGYHPDFALPLDTRDAVNQILAGFNGQFVTFADVQGFNRLLKILAKEEQLQSNEVTGAYVALLPRPLVVFEDVQNQVDRTSGLNVAVGFDYTIWDGFRRVRNIKRQKMKAEQKTIDRENKSRDLYKDFTSLRERLAALSEKEAFYRKKVKVKELKEQWALFTYKAGDMKYPNYMDARIERAQQNLETLVCGEDRVFTLIDLATIAGGLERYNARIRH